MKRCPKCGCERFYVTAHITQDWEVDKNGNFVCVIDDVDVTHRPDDMDIWTCANCNYEDRGSVFNVKEKSNMAMNVGLLKTLISKLPDDMLVFVGCEGYCNYNFEEERPFDDTDTFAIVHDGKLFITDPCAIETSNGETI